MKNLVIKGGLFVLLLSLTAGQADAQRSGRKRPAAASGGSGNAGSTTTTGDQPTETQNSNRPPGGFAVYGNLPVSYDTTSAEETKKSMRNDNAYDKSALNERTPLPYEHLRWDDALFAEKVWRELDLREKMNQTFRYRATDDNGSQLFINILLKAVQSGQVTAFEDDRFTTPKTLAEITQMTTGSADTSEVRDVNNPDKVVGLKVSKAAFDATSVNRLRIKEEWVFDREASRMFVRILGICPLKTQFMPDGRTERGSTEMFWVYYPDLRPTLAKYEVYNAKNMGASRMTWEELFEARMFASFITKSTLDNPGNKSIRVLIKDPILALLEGDNIKERIFNYEQDLWSY